MSARDDAIEAGAQALHGDECPDDEHDLCDVGAWDRAAAAVVDAVEPIFAAERERDWAEAYARVDAEARADERERIDGALAEERRKVEFLERAVYAEIAAGREALADLRAQVEALLAKSPRRRMAPLTYDTGRIDGRRAALADVLDLLGGESDG